MSALCCLHSYARAVCTRYTRAVCTRTLVLSALGTPVPSALIRSLLVLARFLGVLSSSGLIVEYHHQRAHSSSRSRYQATSFCTNCFVQFHQWRHTTTLQVIGRSTFICAAGYMIVSLFGIWTFGKDIDVNPTTGKPASNYLYVFPPDHYVVTLLCFGIVIVITLLYAVINFPFLASMEKLMDFLPGVCLMFLFFFFPCCFFSFFDVLLWCSFRFVSGSATITPCYGGHGTPLLLFFPFSRVLFMLMCTIPTDVILI